MNRRREKNETETPHWHHRKLKLSNNISCSLNLRCNCQIQEFQTVWCSNAWREKNCSKSMTYFVCVLCTFLRTNVVLVDLQFIS